MILDPTFLSGFTLVLTGFTGAFLVALWVALVIWTFRDIRARHRDRLVHFLAAALVALLNLTRSTGLSRIASLCHAGRRIPADAGRGSFITSHRGPDRLPWL